MCLLTNSVMQLSSFAIMNHDKMTGVISWHQDLLDTQLVLKTWLLLRDPAYRSQ